MKTSAGLLIYRQRRELEVLLVHLGGPFWTKKGVWGIPKGEYDKEEPLLAAKREFQEEIGQKAPEGEAIDLGEIKISSGKIIKAYAVEGDLDVTEIKSNTILIEWPPRSGQKIEVPEVDKAAWQPAAKAVNKMHKGQEIFIERLAEHLGTGIDHADTTKPSQSSLF